MIQTRYYRILLMVILLLTQPIIMASDWVDLNNNLEKDFLEYVDKAEIDELTKKKHDELIEQLCKIHEQVVKSNNVFEIMRYYNQFNPEPDVKLDLVLAQLWFDALRGWYITSSILSDNLTLVNIEWRKKQKKIGDYFIDELPDDCYTIPYCNSLLEKSGKKYFNILNYRLLNKHNPIVKYVFWLKKAETANEKALKLWENDFTQEAAKLAIAEYKDVLPDKFPYVWLNALMEYADFQQEFAKIQKRLEQLFSFYNNQKNSEPQALEYLRRLKNAQLSEYKQQDELLREYLFSNPTQYYSNYRDFQYDSAVNSIWIEDKNIMLDDKDTMRDTAMQLLKLTPFIPYLNESTVKWIMEVQRKFKNKFGEEYQDIVTESKLLPNNWKNVFEKLTPP
ncbi:MAG: hypothetical protein KAH84_06805 [Thiomargarita sp.]|nr:hypothetical protein [Bacteroidales bacterium]MCK5719645.1 hypothetical protein [Thiomargarita sp.]